MQLHNHYSVCLYNRGQFTSVADPGEGNKDFEGKAVDEYGRKFSYKCPVPECPRSISKAKPVGFKEWAIHAGVTHHLVEKVMEEEAVKTPAMKEVLAEVAKVRAEAGWCWTTYRCPSEKRSNNCLLCAGKDKDGLNLSLDPRKLWQVKVYNKSFYSILIGRKILRHPPITFFSKNFLQKLVHLPYWQVRYYYASCYFDSGVYMSLGGSYLPDLVCCASEILKLQSLKLRRPEHQ